MIGQLSNTLNNFQANSSNGFFTRISFCGDGSSISYITINNEECYLGNTGILELEDIFNINSILINDKNKLIDINYLEEI